MVSMVSRSEVSKGKTRVIRRPQLKGQKPFGSL